MPAHVGYHAHDAVCRDDTHVALDAIQLTFVNYDIVVGLVGAVVDDLCWNVFIQRVAVADVVGASGSVVDDRELLAKQCVLFSQLFVG